MPTQSYADERRAANTAQGYDPDALHRTLDWIGRQFGSDRASRQPGPSGGSRVLDWIGRQFESDPWRVGGSRNPGVTDPLDRSNPAVKAWFESFANSPTPFGDVQYGPNKPVTKISSGPKIAKKLATQLSNSPPQMPGWFDPQPGEDRPDAPQWPPPMSSIPDPWVHDEAGGRPLQYPSVDMRPPPGPGPMPPEFNLGSLPPRDPSWWDRVNAGRINPDFLRSTINPPPPRPPPGPSPFTSGWSPSVPDVIKNFMPQLRAHGGPVGLMRGGYPDLFGADRMPVRHTFDSGGQNYVEGYGESSGRSDEVNAKLSPKEYVMDAESMALLGDGNPDHGAQKMDQMRSNLRRQKGAALAKGKFSPKAKSAQEYLVGNPMGDGLRRRGKDKG